jgi:hypothetical protein
LLSLIPRANAPAIPLSWNEIKHRAIAFSREWKGTTSEKSERQTFWNEFFEVFGKKRRTLAAIEEPVKKFPANWGSSARRTDCRGNRFGRCSTIPGGTLWASVILEGLFRCTHGQFTVRKDRGRRGGRCLHFHGRSRRRDLGRLKGFDSKASGFLPIG